MADIILKFRYKESGKDKSNKKGFVGFFNYTDDKNKTDEKNDYSLVDYTSRSSANFEAENGTFNNEHLNMSKEEVQEIKNKLKKAEQNKNNLNYGLLSFDNEFLEKNKIIIYENNFDSEKNYNLKLKEKISEIKKHNDKLNDEEIIKKARKEVQLYKFQNRKVDQIKLKKALRNVLEGEDGLLKKQNFSDSAFWWGNIHLNTNHVHIHFGISETNNVKNKKTTIKNFKQTTNEVKRKINYFLSEEYQKAFKEINVEVYSLKKDIKIINSKKLLEMKNNYDLLNAYSNLPKDKKTWRSKSNSKDIKKSKEYISSYLNKNFLNEKTNPNYKKFVEMTFQKQEKYINSYGKNKKTLNILNNAKEELLNELSQQVFNEFKNLKKENFTFNKKKFAESLSKKDLNNLINELTVPKEKLVFKRELKNRNYKEKIKINEKLITQRKEFAKTHKISEELKMYFELKNNSLINKNKWYQSSLKDSWNKTDKDKQIIKDLKFTQVDVKNEKIKKFNNEISDALKKHYTEEKKIFNKLNNGDIKQLVESREFSSMKERTIKKEFLNNTLEIISAKNNLYNLMKLEKNTNLNDDEKQKIKIEKKINFNILISTNVNNKKENKEIIEVEKKKVKKEVVKKNIDSWAKKNNISTKTYYQPSSNSLNNIKKVIVNNEPKARKSILDEISDMEEKQKDFEIRR